MSRRESAVTRQFLASAKPGINRFTACSPKPTIPKLIMEGLLNSHRCGTVAAGSPAVTQFHLETDIAVGTKSVVADCEVVVKTPVLASIESTEINLVLWLPAYRNSPLGSMTSNNGAPPALKGESVIWVRTPVVGSTENTEMLLVPRLPI